jgi:hypothetical protein
MSLAELVMTETLGLDWKNLFELHLVSCKKPLFQRTENPFYKLDRKKQEFKGQKIKTVEEMRKATEGTIRTFLEGNSNIVTQYFCKDKEQRIAFFGGNFVNDIHSSARFSRKFGYFTTKWDTFAISQEFRKGFDLEEVDYFVAQAAKVARWGVTDLQESLHLLSQSKKIIRRDSGLCMSTMATAKRITEKDEKPHATGYEFWKKIGAPKYTVAPMVNHSERPFRMLTRKYGA